MNPIQYTYSIIRYVHDPVAGEMLNIGLLLLAPARQFVGVRLEHHYERLSSVFDDFDGDHFLRILRDFEDALDRIRESWATAAFDSARMPHDVGLVGSLIWPDQNLSFQFGPVLAGIDEDATAALNRLFQRMVTSQAPHQKTQH